MLLTLPTRLTAFTHTADEAGRVLMVRHERLGAVTWELPGSHVEPNETVRAAAARETFEETSVAVEVGALVAEGVHRCWGRTVGMLFFTATATADYPLGTDEPVIRAVEWVDPSSLNPAEVSPLGYPVIRHLGAGSGSPLRFTATHRETPSGWRPLVTSEWTTACECQIGASAGRSSSGARPSRRGGGSST